MMSENLSPSPGMSLFVNIDFDRMRKLYEKNEFPVDKYFYLEHQLKERDPHSVAQIEYDLEEKEFKKQN